jgi:hypothetical protein
MTLDKKIGPLPVWAWGAAIATGILIYYFRTNSKAPIVAGATDLSTPLDPTQGSFSMPSGISSGGLTPEATALTSQDVTDAVGNALLPILSVLPYASAPGEPSTGGAGTGVADTIATIQALKDAGLIQTLPAASTGAATSKGQSHTKPAATVKRVNRDPGNPRKGETYVVKVNPKGHPHGTYHVYGKKTFIKVK